MDKQIKQEIEYVHSRIDELLDMMAVLEGQLTVLLLLNLQDSNRDFDDPFSPPLN